MCAWGKTSNVTVWRWVYVTSYSFVFRLLVLKRTSSPSSLLFFVGGVGFRDPNLFPMKNLFSSSSSFYCLLLTVFAAFSAVRSDSSDHRYKQGDIVPLYANKVGPFHNPRYLDLKPFHCISSLFFFLFSYNCLLFSFFFFSAKPTVISTFLSVLQVCFSLFFFNASFLRRQFLLQSRFEF